MSKLFSSIEIETVNENGKKKIYRQSGSPQKQEIAVEIADISPVGERTVKVAKPMDSYVGNFIRIFEGAMEDATFTVTDTGGTGRSCSGQTAGQTRVFGIAAAANDATFGVVVGTGTNAVAIADTKLQTQIAEGTGAGQLTHQIVQWNTYQTVSTTTSFVVKRRFTNGTGSTITIQELALYVKTGAFPFFKFCVFRDLVGVSGYAVVAGATCEVQITIPITLGQGFLEVTGRGLFKQFTDDATIINNVANSAITIAAGFAQFNSTDSANDATYGVVCGTGTTASVITDHALATQIAQGSGAGQFVHGATQFDAIATTGTVAYCGIKRTFTNSSGGSITIREVAIYTRFRNLANNLDTNFCIFRVVLSVPQVVINGLPAQCKINYGCQL